MAVKPPDLVQPAGELLPEWFARTAEEVAAHAAGTGGYASDADKLAALLTGWLAQAPVDAEAALTDAQTKAYGYRRAYAYLRDRALYAPAEGDVDEKGSYKFTKEQLAFFERRAAHWEAAYDESVTEAEATYAGWPAVHSLR